MFESRGWRHEVWSQAPSAVLANVRFLAACRHQARVPAELTADLARPLSGATVLERAA